MAVKPGETVLVVTDTPQRKIGDLLREAAEEAGAEALLIVMKPRATHGSEPPALVAQAMRSADVVLAPSSRSLSHTQARRDASGAGARIATLPNISEDTMARTLSADYAAIARRSSAMAEILSRGKTARLTTPAGTDLTLGLDGREAHPDTGIIHHPGDFSNLPAGEAYIAPMEGTTNGVLVVDGAMAAIGLVNQPIRMTIRDGYAEEIWGGEEAERLSQLIEPLGKDARNIAELGVGANDRAKLVGSVLEDEKVMGTVHVALGDNSSFGGNVKVQSHLDGILLKPTLFVDDLCVIRDGELLIGTVV